MKGENFTLLTSHFSWELPGFRMETIQGIGDVGFNSSIFFKSFLRFVAFLEDLFVHVA